eukprot:8064865-Pyramimonas_sp.AAC.1
MRRLSTINWQENYCVPQWCNVARQTWCNVCVDPTGETYPPGPPRSCSRKSSLASSAKACQLRTSASTCPLVYLPRTRATQLGLAQVTLHLRERDTDRCLVPKLNAGVPWLNAGVPWLRAGQARGGNARTRRQ